MELIDKNTIIIEIDRRISNFKNEKSKDGASKTDKLDLGARIASLEELKVFVNTLELKEADDESYKKGYNDGYEAGYYSY